MYSGYTNVLAEFFHMSAYVCAIRRSVTGPYDIAQIIPLCLTKVPPGLRVHVSIPGPP